jgi:hypothetical protein
MPRGKPRTSYVGAGDTMKITARVAPPLATNVAPAVVNLGAQLASTYGKVTVPAATTAIIDYRVQVAGNATTSPRGFVFGKGGKAADLLGVISPPTDFFGNPEPPPYDLRMVVPFPQQAAAEDEFLVLFDASGRGGAATTTTTVVKAELVAEGAAAHATAPTAQDLATLQPIPVNLANDIGGKVVTGNLSAGNEVDVYRITVAAADRLQIAISGEGEYDVVVSTDGSSDPEGDNTIGYVYSPAKGLPGNDVVDAGDGDHALHRGAPVPGAQRQVRAVDPQDRGQLIRHRLGARRASWIRPRGPSCWWRARTSVVDLRLEPQKLAREALAVGLTVARGERHRELERLPYLPFDAGLDLLHDGERRVRLGLAATGGSTGLERRARTSRTRSAPARTAWRTRRSGTSPSRFSVELGAFADVVLGLKADGLRVERHGRVQADVEESSFFPPAT